MAKMNKRISAAEAAKALEAQEQTPENQEPENLEQPVQSTMLVTSTGRHPVVIVRPATKGKIVIGLVIDLVALIGILGLIYMGRVTPAEGLPWLAMLLGIKGVQAARKNPDSAGALLSLIGH